MSDAEQSTGHLEDDEGEREHFLRIINAFKFYRPFSHRRVDAAERSYNMIPKHHQDLIPNFQENISQIRNCIEHNFEIIKLIIKDVENIFENKRHDVNSSGDMENDCDDDDEDEGPLQPVAATSMDMDRVKTTLKQFFRDWSEEGRQEREACYDPVIKEIKSKFPTDLYKPSSVKILVPGAGLGRLAYELARCGYSCQGNEWSLFMLFASNFVLNKCKDVNSLTVYPWIHQWCNNRFTDDQTQSIRFPDVNPSDLPPESNFSMAAGDFMEIYKDPESWDCVASVFFIDTAHNIISYVETIWNILQPGGYWINLGPLLYHYSDMKDEISIELSYEELKQVIVKFGFQIEKEETNMKTNYIQNPNCMLQYSYDSVFFVARKPV